MSDESSAELDAETIARALLHLSDFDRSLFFAVRYHELTTVEIAEKLNITEPEVERQIRIMNAKFYLAVDAIAREADQTCH